MPGSDPRRRSDRKPSDGGSTMSGARASAARRSRSLPGRIAAVWRGLPGERRLAAVAAFGLLLTLFLPWYQEAAFVSAHGRPVTASLSVTGWGAFSFVEAAVVLVAVSVLTLLFLRGEGRAFHLPGGDGLAITLAGGWTCFLIVWRMLDKQSATTAGRVFGVTGIQWGIFVALAIAGLLTYSGTRIRSSKQPEPPLPFDDGVVFDGHWHTVARGVPPPTTRAQAPSTAPTASDEAPTTASGEATSSAPTASDETPSRVPTATDEDPTIVAARGSGGRSSWRPADHPEWSAGEPHVEWITGARAPTSDREAEPSPTQETRAARPARHSRDDDDQLTIPLEDDR